MSTVSDFSRPEKEVQFAADDGKHQHEDAESGEFVDTRRCGGRALSILMVLGLSVVFLGIGAGALIYAINKNEQGSVHSNHPVDVSTNFTIFVDEYSTSGNYTITWRRCDEHDHEHEVHSYKTHWYQRNDAQQLRHQLDANLTVLVNKNISYWMDTSGHTMKCTFNANVGYQTYIERLGLLGLESEHSEIYSTDTHEKIYVYNGHAEAVNLPNIDEKSFLVRVYADSKTGVLLGWETYFGAQVDSDIFKTSFSFDAMSPDPPNDSVFVEPPECTSARRNAGY